MEARFKVVVIVLAVVSATFGIFGIRDLDNVPYSGFFTGPTNEITRVFPGSPAESAGLEVGDVLQSVDGISLSDTRALARRERPALGETRMFMVDRDGGEVELAVTYSGQPEVNRTTSWLGLVVGLCFLAFPMWAYVKAPSAANRVLALFGLCFGAAFTPGPYSSSYFLRTLGGSIGTTAVVLGFAFLVHFVLLFPRPRPFLDRPSANKIIYWPAIGLAAFFLYLTVFTPDTTDMLGQVIGLMAGIFIVSFFGWAVVAMIQTYNRATAEERSRYGLTQMLIGTLVGLVPLTLANLIGSVAPAVQANLPGVQFYFLGLGLIPLTFAMSAAKASAAE